MQSKYVITQPSLLHSKWNEKEKKILFAVFRARTESLRDEPLVVVCQE